VGRGAPDCDRQHRHRRRGASRCRPIEELHFVFPNGNGHIESHSNVVQRGLAPTLIAAGVTVSVKDDDGKPMCDDDGKPMIAAKYPGLHAFRHFYASWCINRRADGGLELPLKIVQERLGHATITMTADRYGHLFARADDSGELSAGESLLLG
jgi:integrase